MKKVLAILIAIVMLATGSVIGFAADGKTNTLQFNQDGKFKIVIFSDPQDGYPLEEDLPIFMSEMLDKTQPDLVVLLGDNVMSPKDRTEESYWLGYDQMLQPIVDHGVPFTFVFGNHDDESMKSVTKEQMLAKYQSYPGCLAYDAVPELHGCATHNLEILSSDGTKTAFNLWLMDSGDYVFDEGGNELYYDCVRKDQIEWYENTSKALEAANGSIVPSLMFQHIVPEEVAKQVMVSVPFRLGKLGQNFTDGTAATYLPNLLGFYKGHVGEKPCPSEDNDGQWDAMVERNDVLACFFGHDHTNTYVADVNGIDAVNVPGCTFRSYHSYTHQGAVVLELDESDLSTYSMELITSADLALEDGSKLPGLSHTKTEYFFAKVFRVVLDTLLDVLRDLARTVVIMPY